MAEEEQPEWLKELHEQPEADPYYPGTDPDGKKRMDLFAGRFASEDSTMQGVSRPEKDFEAKPKPGAVQRSPFV